MVEKSIQWFWSISILSHSFFLKIESVIPSTLDALFFAILVIALNTSYCVMCILGSPLGSMAFSGSNVYLTHSSFIIFISSSSVVYLTSSHSISPLFAFIQSCLFVIGPYWRLSIPVLFPYLVNFLADLCHSLANLFMSFFFISFQNTYSYLSWKIYLIV